MKKTTRIVSASALALVAGALSLGLATTSDHQALASIATEGNDDRIELNLNAEALDTGDALRLETESSQQSPADVIRTSNSAPNRSPAVLPADDAETLERRREMYLDYSEEAPAQPAEELTPS